MIHILGLFQTKVEDIGPPFMCVHYPYQTCVCISGGRGGIHRGPHFYFSFETCAMLRFGGKVVPR